MAIYMWREETPAFTGLCFTAEEANSTVQLNKNGAPTSVNLEISTDGTTWIDYAIGDTITLANIGDKVYMRNKSEIDTGFSMDMSNFYRFSMTGKIGANGDITSLLNKNGTTTLTDSCFLLLFNGNPSLITAPELPATKLGLNCYRAMFQDCTNLTTAPSLPAMTLYNYCYSDMFSNCTSLTTPPELPATTLAVQCCRFMFLGCSNIKLSTTQTGEYQIPYRIPTTGTGTTATSALQSMFTATGGTFTGTPTINTTYYLSNGKIEHSDVLTTTYNQTTNSTTYYYGEKFTALKSGQISEVGFLHDNTLDGLMVILDVSTNAPTNYSLSSSNTIGGVYTLSTPYNIEEGKSYIIGVKRSSGNNLPYQNTDMGYPIVGDVVQYTNGVSMTTSYGVSLSASGFVFKYIKTLT